MSVLSTLLKKELLEVVRDRRTLLLTLGMPLFLYPAVMLGMGLVIEAGRSRLKSETVTVAFASEEALALVGPKLPARTTGVVLGTDAAIAKLSDKQVDAVVEVAPGAADGLERGGQVVVTVRYTRRFDRSVEALERLRPLVQALSDRVLSTRLVALRLEAGFVVPVKLEAKDVDFEKDLGPLIAASLLPVTLLVWLLVGAMTAAVDLIAGEKERGTLETLLVSAASPRDILLAKALVVLGLSVSTTFVNLLAMAATFAVGFSGASGITMSYRLGPGQLATMLLALIPAAVLVTGLAVMVASLARTQREGQTWMSPLILVGIAPAILVQMPGMELDALTAAIPLLNVSLLVKTVILKNAAPLYVAETVASVLVFSAAVVWLAARVFDSELARLGGTGSLGEVFSDVWRASRRLISGRSAGRKSE